MRLDFKRYVAQCLSCTQTKGALKTAPILEYPLPAGPFEVFDIDLFQLPSSHQGSPYVLVRVDHFSRFVVLALLPNKSVHSAAHALFSKLIYPSI